ncbi:MAG: hypothetical protein ABL918_05245 [Chakrabartia sp.]
MGILCILKALFGVFKERLSAVTGSMHIALTARRIYWRRIYRRRIYRRRIYPRRIAKISVKSYHAPINPNAG